MTGGLTNAGGLGEKNGGWHVEADEVIDNVGWWYAALDQKRVTRAPRVEPSDSEGEGGPLNGRKLEPEKGVGRLIVSRGVIGLRDVVEMAPDSLVLVNLGV